MNKFSILNFSRPLVFLTDSLSCLSFRVFRPSVNHLFYLLPCSPPVLPPSPPCDPQFDHLSHQLLGDHEEAQPGLLIWVSLAQ